MRERRKYTFVDFLVATLRRSIMVHGWGSFRLVLGCMAVFFVFTVTTISLRAGGDLPTEAYAKTMTMETETQEETQDLSLAKHEVDVVGAYLPCETESLKIADENQVSVASAGLPMETLMTKSSLEEETTSEVVEETESETETETVEVVEEKSMVPSADGAYDYYIYDFTDEEKTYLAQLVYREARGEPLKGIVAVASVAINRLYYSDDFDDRSIYAIITQPGQFASIYGVSQSMLDSNPQCMEAVELACRGWDPTRALFEDGATYFCNPGGNGYGDDATHISDNRLYIGHHQFRNVF